MTNTEATREAIARIIAPEAWSIKDWLDEPGPHDVDDPRLFDWSPARYEESLAKADAILAGYLSASTREAERVRELEAALEPFAKACAEQMAHLQRMMITLPDAETVGLHTFTVRDVRRAAYFAPLKDKAID